MIKGKIAHNSKGKRVAVNEWVTEMRFASFFTFEINAVHKWI